MVFSNCSKALSALIVMLSILLVTGCSSKEKQDSRNLKISNKTDRSIYCFLSKKDSFPELAPAYLDTMLMKFKILPDSSGFIANPPIRSWETFIESSENQKCRILIYSEDTIEKYGLNEVIRKNNWSKKYQFDVDQLTKADWQIIYDGK